MKRGIENELKTHRQDYAKKTRLPIIYHDAISLEDRIQKAAIRGDISELKEIFEKEQHPVDMPCPTVPALFLAAQSQQLKAVEYLLDLEASDYILNTQKNVIEFVKQNGKHTPTTRYLKSRLGFDKNILAVLGQQFKLIIEKELATARARNKPLLVVLGEAHGNYKLYQLEKMMLTVLKELGINVLYRELPQYLSNCDQRQIALAADKLKMQRVYVDTHPNPKASLEKRNFLMALEIMKSFTSGVLITGAAHLKGLLEENLSKHFYHIVPFNLILADSNINCFDAFATDCEKVIQILDDIITPSDQVVKQWNTPQGTSTYSRTFLNAASSLVHYTRNTMFYDLIDLHVNPCVILLDKASRFKW